MARGWTLGGLLLPAAWLVVQGWAAIMAPPTQGTNLSLRGRFGGSMRELELPRAAFETSEPVLAAMSSHLLPQEPPWEAQVDPCEIERPELRPASEMFSATTERPVVSLTFDDGPSRENTPRILSVLARYNVKATFFVLGHRAERMPDLVLQIDADGHDVGNHSWSHASFRSLWQSQIREEICRTSAVIEKTLGKRPSLFRPPFGRYAPSAVPLVGALGYDFVLWSVDSLDWDEEDPAALARTVVREAKPGSIVLLHDRTAVTVRALPDIIRGLQERGFSIEPVSAALDLAPYRVRTGESP